MAIRGRGWIEVRKKGDVPVDDRIGVLLIFVCVLCGILYVSDLLNNDR